MDLKRLHGGDGVCTGTWRMDKISVVNEKQKRQDMRKEQHEQD